MSMPPEDIRACQHLNAACNGLGLAVCIRSDQRPLSVRDIPPGTSPEYVLALYVELALTVEKMLQLAAEEMQQAFPHVPAGTFVCALRDTIANGEPPDTDTLIQWLHENGRSQ